MITRTGPGLKRMIYLRSQITLILAVFLSITGFAGTSKESPVDDVLSFLITDGHEKHPIESDTTRWKEISSEFIDSLSVPIPKERPCGDTAWRVHTGLSGVPMVKRITHSVYKELLVTLHDCNDNLALSFWQKNEDIWKQVGFTKIFKTDAADSCCAVFIGDTSKMCLAVADKYKSFSLYKLDPDNPSVLYSEVLQYNLAEENEYRVSFIYGYTSAAQGCFAARSGKIGYSGWEQLRIYHWDGDSYRPIPIPGVEDAALSSNHVMKAQWLDSPDSKTADFFIPQRYIDDYIIFPCVYRFDGSSWKDVSAECKVAVNQLSFDSHYKHRFRILHDSLLANSYDSIMADTIDLIEKTARFKRRPNIMSGKIFEIAVHFYAKGDHEKAIRMIRILHLPYKIGADITNNSLKQLACLKSLFISAGELSFCGFADTLLGYGRKIKGLEMGSKIEPVPMPAKPPQHPSAAVTAYIEELWPKACMELEQMRKEQSGGMKAIADSMKPYDTLQMLIDRVNKKVDTSSVSSMLSYFSKNYTFNDAQYFFLALRGENLLKIINFYSDYEVPSKVKRKSFDQNIPSSILLSFCNPVHSRIFEQSGIQWDTTDYLATQAQLSYGLALGDSSSLKIMEEMLDRNDSLFENLVWEAISPQWSIKPIAPACAFSFETAWKKRPSIETLERYVSGLIDFALFGSDSLGIHALNNAIEIIEKSGDKELTVTMAAMCIIQMTEDVKWFGFHADSMMKNLGVNEDTLNAILLECYTQMMNAEGFDFRDIVRCLENGGKNLIDWTIKNGTFSEYKELMISLMLVSDLKGYDTLMKPFYREHQDESYSVNRLDFCYILRLGSKKTKLQLVEFLENDSSFRSEKLLLELSLSKSKRIRRSILEKIPLYDADSVGEDLHLMHDWTNNDYLMLINSPHLWKEKWQRLYFFRKFASNVAIKDWWYTIITNGFRGRISTTELLSRQERAHFPLEFACDVMSFEELEKFLKEMHSNPQSKVDLFWYYPVIEQVYSHRLFWEKNKDVILRFAK